jgi:hypothetical protein
MAHLDGMFLQPLSANAAVEANIENTVTAAVTLARFWRMKTSPFGSGGREGL